MLLLGLGAALASPALSEEKKAPARKDRKYALVIAVRSYKPAHLRSLKYTDRDARALQELLPRFGYRVILPMTYEAAAKDADLLPTGRNIKDMLDAFLADRRKDDTVLVVFLGHSIQFKGEAEHYLCGLDADLTDRDTLVPFSLVYRELRKCNAGTKLFIGDMCRPSPQSPRSTVKLEPAPRPQDAEVPGGLRVLFSCSAGECSHESDYLHSGIFCHYLLEGLRGKAATLAGELSFDGLVKYLRDEVSGRTAVDVGARTRQFPLLLGDTSKFVLRPGLRDGAEFTNSVGMKLKLIAAGKFKMGSPAEEAERDGDEGPVHDVAITRPYYLGVYEVTQGQYQKVMGSNPSFFSSRGGGKDRVKGLDTTAFPVDSVSWDEAKQFCDRLSALPEEKAARRVYRLPTEAEWEYACRAGARASLPFAFGESLSSREANFNGQEPYGNALLGPNLNRTTKVGSYKPNAWGLHDMHGNVREWCADTYDKDWYDRSQLRDPLGPPLRSAKVLRGGAWSDIGRACRSAYRAQEEQTTRSITAGLRVVCVAAPPE
jgi:formylglycine-generating enzyme required for sulfatase activity